MATKLASDSWVVTPTREGSMDNGSLIMSSVKLKEKSSVRNCSCGVKFSVVIMKKHWCKNCGDVFCGNCSKMKPLLQTATGKKFRERVCQGCEDKIDNGSHPTLEPYREHEYFKAGLGYDMDQENDASRINSASKLIAHDSTSKKRVLVSPKPLNKSGNSFTFTNYLLSPTTIEKKAKGVEGLTDASVSSDGSTVLESTVTTVTANDSICSNQSSVHFNQSSDVQAKAGHSVVDGPKQEVPQSIDADLTTSGYTADGSVSISFADQTAATPANETGAAVDYEASLTAPSMASAASTVLTNASISSVTSKRSELSAVKAQSYDMFVSGMEGTGTEARTAKPDVESTEAEMETEGEAEGECSMSEDSNKSFSQKLQEVSTCVDSDDELHPMLERVSSKDESKGGDHEGADEVEETTADPVEDFTSTAPVVAAKKSQVLARTGGLADVSAVDGSAIDFEGVDQSMSTMMMSRNDASLLKGVRGCGGTFESTSEAVQAVESSIVAAEETVVDINGSALEETESSKAAVVEAEQDFAVQMDVKVLSSAPKMGPPRDVAALRRTGATLLALIIALATFCAHFFGVLPSTSVSPSIVLPEKALVVVPGKGKRGAPVVSVLPRQQGPLWALPCPSSQSVSIFSNPTQVSSFHNKALLPRQGFLLGGMVSPSKDLSRMSAHLVPSSHSLDNNKPVDPVVYMAQEILKSPFHFVAIVINEIRLLGEEMQSPGFTENMI